MIEDSEPFLSYESYIQQDILLNINQQPRENVVPKVIEVLSGMGFPVDSCVTSATLTFIKTAFVLNPARFPAPKHHFIKVSLLVEVPVHASQPINIKYAVCTTCARCEQWYCDNLPVWAKQPEYRVLSRIQQLIFDFKKRLAQPSG